MEVRENLKLKEVEGIQKERVERRKNGTYEVRGMEDGETGKKWRK